VEFVSDKIQVTPPSRRVAAFVSPSGTPRLSGSRIKCKVDVDRLCWCECEIHIARIHAGRTCKEIELKSRRSSANSCRWRSGHSGRCTLSLSRRAWRQELKIVDQVSGRLIYRRKRRGETRLRIDALAWSRMHSRIAMHGESASLRDAIDPSLTD